MKKTVLTALVCLSFASPALADDEIADIYKAKCKSCHGETGDGDTKTGRKEKIDDLSLPAWQKKHSDEEIRKVISEGSPDKSSTGEASKMKPFKDKLSAAEIDGLVKYIRGLAKK